MGTLIPALEDVEQVTAAMRHSVSRALPCRKALHINLQELDEMVQEVGFEVGDGSVGSRAVNGADSNVAIGGWGKGRSGSAALNRSLQRGGAWQVFGRRSLSNFRLGTKWNPSDDPTRFVKIREPEVSEAWMAEEVKAMPSSRLLELVALITGEPMIPAPIAVELRRPPGWRLCAAIYEEGPFGRLGGWISSYWGASDVPQGATVPRLRKEADGAERAVRRPVDRGVIDQLLAHRVHPGKLVGRVPAVRVSASAQPVRHCHWRRHREIVSRPGAAAGSNLTKPDRQGANTLKPTARCTHTEAGADSPKRSKPIFARFQTTITNAPASIQCHSEGIVGRARLSSTQSSNCSVKHR